VLPLPGDCSVSLPTEPSAGLNLVDGTFEIGVLLVIRDEKYWEKYADTMILNDEFADPETQPFFTTDAKRLASTMRDSQCADTSLIALVEGILRLHQLDARE
jgi:hypothetical protein